MNEHLIHDYEHFFHFVWAIIFLVFLVIALMLLRFRRVKKVSQQRFLNASNHSTPNAESRSRNLQAAEEEPEEIEAHDTVFILPDISQYTRFIAGKHFSAARSQEIIFSLINAMIEASTDTFELSKVEGDAALFFADARQHSSVKIGQKVIAIFDAFYEEKKLIMESGLCSCDACQHIDGLDLKIFVHRGKTARFNFRGSVDHFGADVIILHRLMKNSVDSDRYVMVTDAARDSVSLNGNFTQQTIEEDLEHVGKIRATVHMIEAPVHMASGSFALSP